MISSRISLTFIFILFTYLVIRQFKACKLEKFLNYLTVADNRDLYMRFLDYIHGGYHIPEYIRNRGYYVYDIYGNPHYIDAYADPYLTDPYFPDFKGHYFHMPHDRKVIRIG
jgi:hypothetical protein